jgi:glycosyltransferase involved in cell wall biosynthesis
VNQRLSGEFEMRPQPLVSYIVPCFNNELYIKECLDSINSQRASYPNIEIIFVDDGSSDNSYQVALENISNKDTAIRLNENTGVGHALNTGFSVAKGDYLCFFAADDVILENDKTYCQQMIMQTTTCDLSYYLDWYTGKTINKMKRISAKFTRNSIPIGYFLNYIVPLNNWILHKFLMMGNPINSGSLMITRKAYETYGAWNEEVLTTDYELLLRYSRLGAKFRPIRGAPIFYRVHSNQSSTKNDQMKKGIEESRRLNK